MIQIEKKYDVVVIGSGGGLRAAISAAQQGARTLVVCRGKVNRSGATLLAGANISADIACDGASLARLGISKGNEGDTPERWFQDLVREGFYLNNQEMLTLFTETAGQRLEELMCWGMKVQGMEGEREVSVVGSDILDALYKKAKALGVEFLSDTIFTDLIVDEGRVCGLTCLNLANGQLQAISAKAVVLATGGAHGLFSENSGSTDLCGEGQAAALRAGAELVDMEMISFCPTVICRPYMYKGNILPYILFSSGYGQLLNRIGKTFTSRYLSPKVERLALESEWNKMLLSYAVQSEINQGRGARDGGVYYAIDRYPLQIWDEMYEEFPSLKQGLYKEMIDALSQGSALNVQPAAHYFEGGVWVAADMSTSLPGLFAAGECAGGMFGANRVSSAITEMLVEGAQAGLSAAAFAQGAEEISLPRQQLDSLEEELLAPFGNSGGPAPRQLRRRLHEITADSLMVIRSEASLERALRDLDGLQGQLEKVSFADSQRLYNRQWREYLELRAMIPCARAIARSALLRRESRGVHIRSDHFYTDNSQFLHNIVLSGTELRERCIPAAAAGISPASGRWGYTQYVEKIVEELE